MLFDLGISSDQLDDPARGLSFQHSGPLDMRLDPSQPETALTPLHKIQHAELKNTLIEFGEPRHAEKLSRAILDGVAGGRLKTTSDLAMLCERVIGRHGPSHPATRVFLALRNLVNQELSSLDSLLNVAPGCLNREGRLVIISFHSLEDRRVKERFRTLAKDGFRIVTPKPVVPSEQEQVVNPRARSAKLRVLERVS